MVKFPENNQGEVVLANEFLACQLAAIFDLPINRAVFISIDERILRNPRADGRIRPDFTAGIRCGMIRYEQAEGVGQHEVEKLCNNHADLHGVAVFEQLVAREDGRQILLHPDRENGGKRFAAFDYGFAFSGQPVWSADSLPNMRPPALPTSDPFAGQPYPDGSKLGPFMDRLREVTLDVIAGAVDRFQPPRWGIMPEDIAALVPVLHARAQALVDQFDRKYRPQLEAL
jgi:hypothetical protein